MRQRLQAWRGKDLGLSRRWLEDAVAGTEAAERPAARLTLLAALAPIPVDDDVLRDFRATHSGHDTLIAATAWASFEAVRRIGSWLAVPR